MGMPDRKPIAEKPMGVGMLGYEVFEKAVKPCVTSARILVPRGLAGKRVIMGCL